MEYVRLCRLFLPSSSCPVLNSVMKTSEGYQAPYWALGGLRHKIRKPRVNKREEDGPHVVKCYGFNYYPRFPGEVDPPYEPSKLFAVKRVRTLKKRPYWERQIVEGELGLGSRRTVAIVKNSPTQNASLYKVKHLIKITPITFPHGLPSDPKNGFLKENGEFVVYDKLSPIGADSLEQVKSDVLSLQKRDVDGATLKKRLSLLWQSRW